MVPVTPSRQQYTAESAIYIMYNIINIYICVENRLSGPVLLLSAYRDIKMIQNSKRRSIRYKFAL